MWKNIFLEWQNCLENTQVISFWEEIKTKKISIFLQIWLGPKKLFHIPSKKLFSINKTCWITIIIWLIRKSVKQQITSDMSNCHHLPLLEIRIIFIFASSIPCGSHWIASVYLTVVMEWSHYGNLHKYPQDTKKKKKKKCVPLSGSMICLPNISSISTFCLILSMLGKKLSRWHFEIFLTFPRKQDLTFHANCLQETICMKCHIMFSGEK